MLQLNNIIYGNHISRHKEQYNIMKRWNFLPHDPAKSNKLAEESGLPFVLADILSARGIDAAHLESMFPNNAGLSDPFLLADMDKAVQRIQEAVEAFEKIAVYGDYDADGVTATALLYSYLETCGADVLYYIPERDTEGYGLNCDAIDQLAAEGVRLIITVDNGIASVPEVQHAATLGIDVVITDHHCPQAELPQACAVVNPHRPDCSSSYKEFSGVGVAFKLVTALEGAVEGNGIDLLDSYADLLAIGTIADIVPLTGENRIFVIQGLELLAQPDRPGLQALAELFGLEDKALTATRVAFSIVPCINAAGRIGSPARAVQLLLSEYTDEAYPLAEELYQDNEYRKQIENDISEQAVALLEKDPQRMDDPVLVVEGVDWNPGVIGIVAARLSGRYGKPCMVISCSGDEAKGSGRSIEGFSLFEAVCACEGLLTKFGGHPMAAGISLHTGAIPAFRQAINAYAARQPRVLPSLTVDCVLNPQDLGLEVPRALQLLEPFGEGNPQPLIGVLKMKLAEITPLSGGKHLRFTFMQNDYIIHCVKFNITVEQFEYCIGDLLDLAVTLEAREYHGAPRTSIHLRAYKPAGMDLQAVFDGFTVWEQAHNGAPLSKGQKERLLPTREDFAVLYRYLRSIPGFSGGLEALLARMPSNFSAERLLICLDVLQEHKLIRRAQSGLRCEIFVLPAAKKVDLFQSKILDLIYDASETTEGV